jgi:uncharacterized protein
MFLSFLSALRSAKIPVSLKEHLMLLEAMQADIIDHRLEDFYFLTRAIFVKDEALLDRFDQVFSHVFKGIESNFEAEQLDLPQEWLRALAELHLSAEEQEKIQALGDWQKLMDTLKKRLEEQKERHEGGSKWIGTGGTSPFGAYGYNPEGVRIGQDKNRHNRAVKVWDKRAFKNLDSSQELGTRNIKIALRRLRKFARTGMPDELDLGGTIQATAKNAYLDVVMRPQKRNAIKVLLFLDVGGSMDPHIRICEELFSAATSAFKHLEFFYFHNCLYESVWKDNQRRWSERVATWDILHKYPHDYKVIFVGDASMSPYEILYPGGSVEHWNEEAGEAWLARVAQIYPNIAWLNPIPEQHWSYSHSIDLVRQSLQNRMYPLTLEGLDRAMRALAR